MLDRAYVSVLARWLAAEVSAAGHRGPADRKSDVRPNECGRCPSLAPVVCLGSGSDVVADLCSLMKTECQA